MKVVILAGGLGTRLSEETEAKPRPMVEIGGKPILWHIMQHYRRHVGAVLGSASYTGADFRRGKDALHRYHHHLVRLAPAIGYRGRTVPEMNKTATEMGDQPSEA